MTQDGFLALGALFTSVWSLFTSWYIPGTHMTPAEWAFFVLTVRLLLGWLKRLFGGNKDE